MLLVAPARERGLKFGSALGAVTGGSRSREGAWIEINKSHDPKEH